MGGLIPDWKNFYDEINHVVKPIQMGPVWMEAAHISGTTINSTIWIKDPPASSYLSCIAVKAAGLQSAAAEDQYLLKLRTAVMQDGVNIAYESTLLRIASELQTEAPGILDTALFSADLENGRGKLAFKNDLDEVQRLQISRFPTFLLRSEGHTPLLITGFRPYDRLATAIEKMLANKNEHAG